MNATSTWTVVRRALALGTLVLTLPGCGVGHRASEGFDTPRDLAALVTGRTMSIGGSADSRLRLLVYLAPDGTGWLDSRVDPTPAELAGTAMPNSMSMLAGWGVADGSDICAWASPLIGEMPSFAPAQPVCIHMVPAAVGGSAATAGVWWDGSYRVLPVQFYPFNAFAPALTEQYRRQVRVLYGGRIPDWPRL